jgi:hypothetical protein
MSDISKDSRLFSFPDIETPLGRLHFGGILRGGIGTGLRGYRQYGMYAVVLVQAGEGIYRDATGAEIPLVAGDVIMVFQVDGGMRHLWRFRGLRLMRGARMGWIRLIRFGRSGL